MIETIKKHADVLEDVPLNKYNTYHIGGITKYLVSPLSINDLVEVIKILDENKKLNGPVINIIPLDFIELNSNE